MSSRSMPRMVAWISTQEWRETRDLLFSDKKENVQEGCSRLRIWMERGKVPTAVESTLNFLDVILSDAIFTDEYFRIKQQGEEMQMNSTLPATTQFLEKSIRMAYAAAIIRFVNELVDQAQHGAFATSIARLADSIGLPRFFVDIRHDCTHDQLSSIELLRWASMEALKWLEVRYWSVEDDRNVGEKFIQQVHQSLDSFVEQLLKISPVLPTEINVTFERNVASRLIQPVDYLLTVESVMKDYLNALASYPRAPIVLQCIIKQLIAANGYLFVAAFTKLWIVAPKRSPLLTTWLPWIMPELEKNQLAGEYLLKVCLQLFAANSSAALFEDRLLPLWKASSAFNSKYQNQFAVFSRAYSTGAKININGPSQLEASREIVRSRRCTLPDSFDDWCEAGENWRPCPLGHASIAE